jgi:hypothetical protein
VHLDEFNFTNCKDTKKGPLAKLKIDVCIQPPVKLVNGLLFGTQSMEKPRNTTKVLFMLQ